MTQPTIEARATAIATELRRQILQGKWEPGDRLPSERDLAARHGVHRSSVREALKALEQLGMIAIRRGGGARVLPLEDAGLGVLPHLLSEQVPRREIVLQWLDVWEIVQAGTARLAVERATDAEFSEALSLLRRMRSRGITPEEFLDASDQLTAVVAKASGNVVLRMVRNDLIAQAHERAGFRLMLVPSLRNVTPLIKALERAVEARDPQATEEGVRRLIRQNRQMVVEFFEVRIPAN